MAPHWPPSTAPSTPCFSNTSPKEPCEAGQMETALVLSQSSSPNTGYGVARAGTTSATETSTPIASSSAAFAITGNSYVVEDSFQALDPALLDKPFNGCFLCSVLGCPSTFTRKADRDRHVQSWHNFATLHLCPVLGCEKRFGKPYSRKDKLQEHMRKKHPAPVQAVVQGKL